MHFYPFTHQEPGPEGCNLVIIFFSMKGNSAENLDEASEMRIKLHVKSFGFHSKSTH